MAVTHFSDVNIVSTVISGGGTGDLTVTGISTEDELKAVLDLGAPADLTDEFTISADDTINNDGGSSSSGNSVLVMYIDKDL